MRKLIFFFFFCWMIESERLHSIGCLFISNVTVPCPTTHIHTVTMYTSRYGVSFLCLQLMCLSVVQSSQAAGGRRAGVAAADRGAILQTGAQSQ